MKNYRISLYVNALLLAVVTGASAVPAYSAPERRKDQFPAEYGYLLAPLPYSMPGIGEGLFVLGNFSNIFDTTIDANVVLVTGEARGKVIVFDEVPLYKRNLFLHAEVLDINTVVTNNYDSRGMDTNKDDYTLLEISSYLASTLNLDLTFFDRKLTFSAMRFKNRGDIYKVRDPKGNIISSPSEPYKFSSRSTMLAAQIDLTDDYLDARKGVRVDMRYRNNPRKDVNDPDLFVTELNSNFFIPTVGNDTLVLNYFQSDTNVRKRGNVDRDVIRQELGLQCQPGDQQCLTTEENLIDMFVNQRKYGTASSLGGNNRFRAYPDGRFNGAHVAFVGAEYRWNFVHDATPFNYYIWRDAHTGYQLAFFAEHATVSETWGDIWKDTRTVVGAGARLVTQSGSVYRADLGFGDEGMALSVYFYYPWDGS